MTQFARDEATARRSADVIEQLTEARASLIAGNGVAFKSEHEAVAPTAWSWWMLVTDSARLVLEQTRAGNGLLVAPVARNLMNHAVALPWLIDGGAAAVQAIDSYSDEQLMKLLNGAVEAGWDVGGAEAEARVRQAVADRKSTETPEVTRLKKELSTPIDLMTAYDTRPTYLVYRHLSGFSHTTRDTGTLYLHSTGSGPGDWELRNRPRESEFEDIIGIAVFLMQAGQAVNRILTDHPLTRPLRQATQQLGLPEDLLLTRRSPRARRQRGSER